MRMFSGTRNIDAANGMSGGFERPADFLGDAADVRLVVTIVGDQNVEPIEIRLLAQVRQGVERDVAVDDILHARLRLADVVHAATDAQCTFFSARGANGCVVANARARNLES